MLDISWTGSTPATATMAAIQSQQTEQNKQNNNNLKQKAMEVEGILKMKTNEREGVSDKGPWTVAEFLLLVPGMYERHMVFSVRDGLSARIAQFEAMVESGKPVIVSFDIDAREYEGRWFNDLRAYGVRQKQ